VGSLNVETAISTENQYKQISR